MATRRSSQLNGSHTQSTHPNVHKRLMRRHTITNLQTTTPTQMVDSQSLTERLEQYATQELNILSITKCIDN